MLTEIEAIEAVPRDGFIHDYVIHALKQTTSPACYHLAVGLSLLACTCPLDYGMSYAGRLRANLYTLLVGRSGEDQKSTALGIGRDLLFEAAAPLIGEFPGSPEGLIDSLAGRPSQLIPISEFGRFLSSAQRGYFEPVKALMADAWDCSGIHRVKANNRTVRVDNPRLSIMSACSLPYLEKYTLTEDWTGGFMGRWAVMYGRRERMDPDPSGDMSDFDRLSSVLRAKATIASGGWCRGLSAPARKLWNDWFRSVQSRNLPSQIVGITSRAPTIARKVAMLYAWDWGKPEGGAAWQMELPEVEYGIKFAELHIKSVVAMSAKIAVHPDARLRRSVIDAIDDRGGMATMGDILRRLKMRRRPVTESLDALMEEGMVDRVTAGNGYVYVCENPPERVYREGLHAKGAIGENRVKWIWSSGMSPCLDPHEWSNRKIEEDAWGGRMLSVAAPCRHSTLLYVPPAKLGQDRRGDVRTPYNFMHVVSYRVRQHILVPKPRLFRAVHTHRRGFWDVEVSRPSILCEAPPGGQDVVDAIARQVAEIRIQYLRRQLIEFSHYAPDMRSVGRRRTRRKHSDLLEPRSKVRKVLVTTPWHHFSGIVVNALSYKTLFTWAFNSRSTESNTNNIRLCGVVRIASYSR